MVDDLHQVDDVDAHPLPLVSFVEHKPDWLHLLLLSRRRPGARGRPAARQRGPGRCRLRRVCGSPTPRRRRCWPGCARTPRERSSPRSLVVRGLGGRAPARRSRRPLEATDRPFRRRGDARQRAVGSDRLVDSYLWHEVLRAERDELVELLLATAVVDRMNYGLAEALTGRAMPVTCCSRPRQRGLFVSGFDSGGWFEVHGLVREVLLAELERRSPDRLREQHARAARWLETMGDGLAAIGHWLDAGEPAEALRLLAGISMSGLDVAGADDDRPDPGTDPAGGPGCGFSVSGAVRLVPVARRPGRLPRRPRGGGGRGRRTRDRPTHASSLGILRSDGRLAQGGLAGLHRACPRRSASTSATRRRRDPLGRFGWSLVATGLALDEHWGGSGGRWEVEQQSPRRPSPGFLTRRHARWVSHWPGTRSTPCGSLPVSRRLAEHSRMPVRADRAPARRGDRRPASWVTPSGPSPTSRR